MISNISIAKFYHKPRYCLIINEEFVIRVPKKTWDKLYNYIQEYRNKNTMTISLDGFYNTISEYALSCDSMNVQQARFVNIMAAPGTHHRKKLEEKQ